MTLTIALSGMDNATETALRAAFSGANAQLGGRFVLTAESEAAHVIVDMDSMYGPMSWLRLHASGKQIIGLTSAPRVQTHFRLGRPFDDNAMATLLREVAAAQEVEVDAPATAPAGESPAVATDDASEATTTPAPEAAPAVARASGDPSPLEAGDIPVFPDEAPRPLDIAPPMPASLEASAAAPMPASPEAPAAAPLPEAEPETGRALPFVSWIATGALRGRRRFRSDTGPTLWLDFDAQHYHGPATLKPLTQYFNGAVTGDVFEAVDAATWSANALVAGPPQPLSRLLWLGGLLEGDGTTLVPSYDPEARYQLSKWPQTEREYPRHFRIATAMMKGPATLDEIIAASGVPAEEVIRFVNANLVTGYAEPFIETPEPVETPERSGGFFSRLRRR
ncbi:hypothetical protein CNR27_12730 [Luteimonas chenhongjianii]|uniref:Uncharacterized protein n=1 Tax=Luteimonas chenhongjianii TaxID=2006110 RepID=A0A290XGA4_9GAMM|nr:hypothetical protein [Luteimonas chenhongjianii]ATD68192.1 hypothetical protein CNR27_12730 [Luteimonas chenhongjianii]